MSKKWAPLRREAHFQVKMYKTYHVRTIFASSDVEKVHAVVARSAFRSQHVPNNTKHTILGPLLEVEMSKKYTPLWRETHFQVYKTHHIRTTFGSCEVEKVHAVVARSTFPSENVQNTPFSDHFWKLRSRRSARRCGAKHISKSQSTKHTMYGPLLEVQMSKKCTPLRREAHFQVKMYGPFLQVQMSKKCTPLWREAHFQVKMLKTPEVRTTFGGSDVASLRFTTIHYITLHYTPLHYITLHSTTLQL